MKKLCLLLTLFSLLSCRSMQEATQTIVEVQPDPTMRGLIKSVTIQAYALPQNTLVSDESIDAPSWPVKRTFAPKSSSSSHQFRFLFTAFDEAAQPIANIELQADVIEGASRYVFITLSEQCRPENCDGGVCLAVVEPGILSRSAEEAYARQWYCGEGTLEKPQPALAPSEKNDGGMVISDTAAPSNGQRQTMTGMTTGASTATGTTGTAATGGSTTPSGMLTQDAGVPRVPSMDAECHDKPCGVHGVCSLDGAAPNKYVCTCNTGYEFDATSTTCVVRDDCSKNKGGCEGTCETLVPTGEAKCSCAAPSWLNVDGKQCVQPQAEEALSSGGSVSRTRPQVAFDSAGNGVVAWTETSADGTHSMWSARYSADKKSWEKPTAPFLLYTTNAADLHLALDPSGAGLLVWTATVDSHRQLWSSRYRNNAFSTVAKQIDHASEGDVLMPALALDPLGDGLVAWTDAVYPKSTLRVARFVSSSNSFVEMETRFVQSGDSFVLGTSVALNSADSGIIAWTNVPVRTTGDAGPVADFSGALAFSWRLGALLGSGLSFDNSGPSTSPDVVMDPQGRGIAVWLQANFADPNTYTVLSKVYVPSALGNGGSSEPSRKLSTNARAWSTPRIAIGPDGSAFAVWRESLASGATTTSSSAQSDAKSLARGALRLSTGFDEVHDLGLPSDTAYWNDIDPTMAWTQQSTVALLDQSQPSWDLAVGPSQTGFIVGAAFDTSRSPATRELWLQRVGAEQEPAQPIIFTAADLVPARPSSPKLAVNANGEGAVVWDRQREGRYQVYTSLLQ